VLVSNRQNANFGGQGTVNHTVWKLFEVQNPEVVCDSGSDAWVLEDQRRNPVKLVQIRPGQGLAASVLVMTDRFNQFVGGLRMEGVPH